MTTTTENYIPPAQRRSGLHRDWKAGGFAIRATWKKGTAHCKVCGPVRGTWAVHACTWPIPDAPGDRYEASGMFCDEHRAAHGTLPDLDYTRRRRSGYEDGLSETEHLYPVAGPCDICGKPAHSELQQSCRDCDDPSRWGVSTYKVMTCNEPERTETRRYHDSHVTGEWIRCRDHNFAGDC